MYYIYMIIQNHQLPYVIFLLGVTFCHFPCTEATGGSSVPALVEFQAELGHRSVKHWANIGADMVFINPWLIIYENNCLLMVNNLDNNG